ncbi:MAG: mobilization protein [Anaerostipes sp.]|nr:mobilization protein [Anaerostipes sp.]
MDRNVDNKGRWRKRTVAFRVSEEEAKLLDDCVSLSGLTKQDYILRRLLHREVVVQGNPRVYKALRNQMADIYTELQRIADVSEMSDEFQFTLQLIAETMNGLKEDNEWE